MCFNDSTAIPNSDMDPFSSWSTLPTCELLFLIALEALDWWEEHTLIHRTSPQLTSSRWTERDLRRKMMALAMVLLRFMLPRWHLEDEIISDIWPMEWLECIACWSEPHLFCIIVERCIAQLYKNKHFCSTIYMLHIIQLPVTHDYGTYSVKICQWIWSDKTTHMHSNNL